MRLMRSVVGGCVFVVASVVLLSTLTSTPPTGPAIHSIVAHNLKEELEGSMTCDEEDLERLGFVDGPQLYPHHAWDNLSTPVLASAVWSGQVWQVEGLAGLAQLLLPNLTLMVYSLDLPTYEMQQLEEVCNTSCVVVPFDFSLYPSHVRDHHLRAYRPIIIQPSHFSATAFVWLQPTSAMKKRPEFWHGRLKMCQEKKFQGKQDNTKEPFAACLQLFTPSLQTPYL
uniref:Uncharacterized protein n=1 Tax=Scylla olivacea TaxID=85551 RepID=A0A0N7ZAQ0_SCYOL